MVDRGAAFTVYGYPTAVVQKGAGAGVGKTRRMYIVIIIINIIIIIVFALATRFRLFELFPEAVQYDIVSLYVLRRGAPIM